MAPGGPGPSGAVAIKRAEEILWKGLTGGRPGVGRVMGPLGSRVYFRLSLPRVSLGWLTAGGGGLTSVRHRRLCRHNPSPPRMCHPLRAGSGSSGLLRPVSRAPGGPRVRDPLGAPRSIPSNRPSLAPHPQAVEGDFTTE